MEFDYRRPIGFVDQIQNARLIGNSKKKKVIQTSKIISKFWEVKTLFRITDLKNKK